MPGEPPLPKATRKGVCTICSALIYSFEEGKNKHTFNKFIAREENEP